MKKLWLLVGFMGSVFVSAGAASPRGDGFHGRFVGQHGGPAFRMTRGARGDFRFPQRRFFSQRDHRFFVPQVIWPVYWYPSYNSDYYPFDSSYLDDGPVTVMRTLARPYHRSIQGARQIRDRLS